jgi:hypothetical protein
MAKREHAESCASLATFTDWFGRDRGACTCGADDFNAGRLEGLEEAREVIAYDYRDSKHCAAQGGTHAAGYAEWAECEDYLLSEMDGLIQKVKGDSQ